VQQTKIAVQQTKLSVQQTQLYVQQTQTQLDVGQIVQATVSLSLPSSSLAQPAQECLAADLSRLLFYSRFTVFLASP
jgi:hypothetical protein